jgi:hypothetical protein
MMPMRPGFGARPVSGNPIMRQGSVGPMAGGQMPGPAQRPIASMKKGGKVKKTGLYKLHKNEVVKKAPAKKAKSKTDHRAAKGDSHAYVYGRKA